jgi:hypothetical protein
VGSFLISRIGVVGSTSDFHSERVGSNPIFCSIFLRMTLDTVIILKPISKHGKDRIHQYGERWIVKSVMGNVMFDDRSGLWLGLMSEDGRDFRWVRSQEDKNFIII